MADSGRYEPSTPGGYGTSMHYPYCLGGDCTGCLPPLPPFVREVASGFDEIDTEPPLTYDEQHDLDERLKALREWRARSAVSACGYIIH